MLFSGILAKLEQILLYCWFQFASQSLDLLRVPTFLILFFSGHVVFLSESFQTLFYEVCVLHQINEFAHVKPLQSKP